MTTIALAPRMSAAPRLRITRRGRAVVAVLIALPLAAGAVAFGLGQGAAAESGTTASSSASTTAFHYVTVRDGESLWTVAQRVAPGADPRDVVADLVSLNQLPTAAVQAGERLAIPARYIG